MPGGMRLILRNVKDARLWTVSSIVATWREDYSLCFTSVGIIAQPKILGAHWRLQAKDIMLQSEDFDRLKALN